MIRKTDTRGDADAPRDDEIAALYRELPSEQPSARHDARILAEARAAAALPRGRPSRAWWMRWKLPLAFAATVVLTVSLALRVEREQSPEELELLRGKAPARALPAIPAPGQATSPAPATSGSDAKQKTETIATPLPPKRLQGSQEPREARAPATIQSDQPRFAPEPPPRAKAALDSIQPPQPSEAASPELNKARANADARAAPAAAKPAVPAPPATAGALSSGASAQPEVMREKDRQDSAAHSARREDAGAAATAKKIARSPETWIEDIRSLRRAGREEDAQASLKLFREKYPDFPLPDDLKAK